MILEHPRSLISLCYLDEETVYLLELADHLRRCAE